MVIRLRHRTPSFRVPFPNQLTVIRFHRAHFPYLSEYRFRFGGSLDISLVTIPLKAITIQGAYTGNYNDFVELIELAKKGTIKQIISQRYSLEQANDALENLKQRKIIGRAVINP